jgi:hypothetical protein
VVANCSTVSGIVRQVRRDPADGERNMLIEVDQSYAQFLPSADEGGVLGAAVVPRDGGIEVSSESGAAALTTLPMPGAGSNTAVNRRLTVQLKAP